LLRHALAPISAGKEEVHSYKSLIGGAVHALVDDDKREAVLKGVAAGLSEEDMARLEAIERVPGHNDLGELEVDRLAKWIATVRQSCAELGRADVADTRIGKVLSCAPIGKDGVWPCEPVRDVMEDLQSESMMAGASTGVYNSRGAHFRGEGGDEERELAQKYRKWARRSRSHTRSLPRSSLMELAKTYDHEASREDTEAGIRRRLR
jgi:hypothetical protein